MYFSGRKNEKKILQNLCSRFRGRRRRRRRHPRPRPRPFSKWIRKVGTFQRYTHNGFLLVF